MSKKIFGAVAGLAVASLLVAACGGSSTSSESSAAAPAASSAAASAAASEMASAAAGGKVCVILPDTASSARWDGADKPFLEAAFTAAGVEYDVQNALGDKAKFATIADGMLAGGCTAMGIVNLDSDTGTAVIAKAAAAGVPVVDYDRLTLGGGAKYYVSFDNVAVGTAEGSGLVKCLNDAGTTSGNVALLNGSPTDNNATLFKQGYQKAIEDAGFTITADESVPDWDNTKAGTIFEQMYTKANGDFVGVDAANDGLGGAVIAVLDRNGQAGKIFVTGQDATDEGLQRVLLGTQCVTVYKAVKQEADAAATLLIALSGGDTAAADALVTGTTTDSTAGTEVPSVLLTPQQIFPENVKDVIADGYTTVDKVCTTDEIKAKCAEFGVQ
jgi:D-xylose transport system substrate-binding protein